MGNASKYCERNSLSTIVRLYCQWKFLQRLSSDNVRSGHQHGSRVHNHMAENQSQQHQAAARTFVQHHPEVGSSGNFSYAYRLGEELIENNGREREPAETTRRRSAPTASARQTAWPASSLNEHLRQEPRWVPSRWWGQLPAVPPAHRHARERPAMAPGERQHPLAAEKAPEQPMAAGKIPAPLPQRLAMTRICLCCTSDLTGPQQTLLWNSEELDNCFATS